MRWKERRDERNERERERYETGIKASQGNLRVLGHRQTKKKKKSMATPATQEKGKHDKPAGTESKNPPHVLSTVAELAARNTGTQVEIADRDRIVLVLVRERVLSLGDGADEDTDRLVVVERPNVLGRMDEPGLV